MLDRAQLVDEVREYVRQFVANPQQADRSLLGSAWEGLDNLLEYDDWSPEEARTALDVCVHIGRQDRGNDILRRYLTQRLSVEAEAWARWNLTDGYALCRECESAVKEHRRFLAWARASLPPHRWAWVFMDGTQANCWIQQDVAQDWIAIFRELTTVVPAVEANREDRFQLLRTAGRVFGELHQTQGVEAAVAKMRALAGECETGEAALRIQMEAAIVELNLYEKVGPGARLRASARATLSELDARTCDPETADAPALRLFASLYHNAGAPLYRAKEYGLAVTFLRRSMQYGGGNAHTYGWLSACLHATGGDHGEVLSLLREAAWRDYKGGNLWSRYRRKLPEFADVAEDPEFAAAASLPQQADPNR